ncbi:hypothetical protein L1987_77356 [Smallanthus sonchifolius]|uniref:Uncharacterized protein n=1 Tax=Smallanthus sonchifolius TaxID=185202 RepID=A0ACB8ZAM1_9ASTR|nr:hypothetical protein L1987_77356 [Smallanthus sonchifolius]
MCTTTSHGWLYVVDFYTSDAKSKSEALMMQDRNEEEEFIFVLTDEWKELFAKSEAKRRLAKKQAKKKGKD